MKIVVAAGVAARSDAIWKNLQKNMKKL